jgi:hypothetical protein
MNLIHTNTVLYLFTRIQAFHPNEVYLLLTIFEL